MSKKKPSYRGTQQNLYTLARKAWAYCLLYLIDLAAKNPKYTNIFVNAQLAFVDEAEALPDYENRKAEPADTYADMQAARISVLNEWQFLKGYTLDTFTGTVLAAKLDAAGQGHYEKALGGNLDNTAALINAAKTFMRTNESELLTKGNMPEGFPNAFKALGTAFTALRTAYFGKNDTMDEQTMDKDEADAAILKELRPMLRLGNRVFKNDVAKRNKFSYTKLLDEVRGNSPAGLKGRFTVAGSSLPIAEVRIKATNITTEAVYEAVSDAEGHYLMEMASGKYNMEISATGYRTVTIFKRKIEVGVKHRLNLALEPVVVDL